MSCRGYACTPQSARFIAKQGGTADIYYSSLTEPYWLCQGFFTFLISLAVVVVLGYLFIQSLGFIAMLKNFFQEGVTLAFNHVTKNDNFVLSSDYYRYTSPFAGEMARDGMKKPDVNDIMKNPGKVPFIDNQQRTKYLPAPKLPMPKPNFVETNTILGR